MPIFELGPFLLDTAERRLTRGGERIPLTGKTLQILRLLAEAGGRLVPRETFHARLWPNVTVEERNLTVHVSTLRRLLGAGSGDAAVIETVSGAGYRLLLPVRLVAEGRPFTAAGVPPQPVAILPFSTHGLADADLYLGAGVAEAVAGQLGSRHAVSSRQSDAARNGAAYLLEGAVQRTPDRLSVAAHLVDGRSGATQWQETFEQPVAEGAALQDAIAFRLARWMAPQLPPGEQAVPASYRPRVPEAYYLQLQGRAQLNLAERTPAMKALGLFEQALSLDPEYALAHAGLASTYLLMASNLIRRPMPLEEAMRLARRAAHRAIALDETLGEAWATLGKLKMHYEWDWQGAEADLEHAASLGPNSVDALSAYGRFHSAMGNHEAAIDLLERAQRLDPGRRETLEILGYARWIAGHAESALAALAEAVALPSPERRPHIRRMLVLDQLGMRDRAMDDRCTWLVMYGEAAAADRLRRLEREAGWAAAMATWIPMMERMNLWPEAALQWMALDERGRALDALERGLAERATNMVFVPQYPSLRPLRGKTRFARVLAMMNRGAG